MKAHLSADFIIAASQQNYINVNQANEIGDVKPSIRADLIDREKNFAFEDVTPDEIEKPNSLAINPMIYSNALLHSGEFVWEEIDLHIPGRGFDFVFKRTFRSQAIYSGVLGWGWEHNYNKRLIELYSGDIIYYDGTGRRERFIIEGQPGIYKAPKGWFVELKKMEDGAFRLIYSNRTIEYYDSLGRLIKIQDRNQNKMEFFYNISGQLSGVMDTMGRIINFYYYPVEFKSNTETNDELKPVSGRLWKIVDFSNPVRTVQFNYEENGDLKSVDFEGRVKQYSYSNSQTPGDEIKLNHNLVSIVDPRGAASGDNTPVLTITYDQEDKIQGQDFIEIDQDITFNIGETMATVTDARGNVKTFGTPDGNYRTVTNGGHTTQYNFNEDGLLTNIQFPEGNKINYTYDTTNQNRRSQANLLSVSSEGNDGTIAYQYIYETYFNQVEQIIDAKGYQTNIIHDYHGNIKTITPPDTPPYQFEYYSTSEPKIYGLLHTITDPEGTVNEYIYYPESVPSGDGVQTISGRITNDSTGGYLEEIIIDKVNNHISQSFTYDKVGNIISRIDGEGVTTLYGYGNPFGEVSLITEGTTPAYDGQPGLNLESTFKYDANGNVSEKIIRGIKTTYNYDRLNRLVTAMYQGVLTGDNVQQIFTYHHDNNSNLKEIIYPKGNKDVFTYDDRDLLVNKSLGNGLTKESYSYTANQR